MARRHCFEVAERVDRYGQIITALDEEGAGQVAREIRDLGEIEAVAIMLLFSYLNPAHELRLKEIFAEEAPDLPVSLSYEVLPKWKEYERASTTCADAYLKPVVSRSCNRCARAWASSACTTTSWSSSQWRRDDPGGGGHAPVNMIVSGPTGGVVAGKHVAQLLELKSLVTVDMGGTSTDVSTIPAAVRPSPPRSRSSGACRSRSR